MPPILVDELRVRVSGQKDDVSGQLALDSAHFDAFLDGAPRPTVFVLRARDLQELLGADGVRSRVAALGRRHAETGLAHYFHDERPVALEGR